jgi:hypothetical protein
MATVQIEPVMNKADLKAFVDLPWRLYQGDPNWIPPLKSEFTRLIRPGKHPFWEFARRELFLARRGAEVVGRIASIVDDNYNRHYSEKMAGWGFFECENDPETAMGLFMAAEKWARDQGMASIRGPLNPSVNYEIGLLIQRFDEPPVLGFTYNPAYYLELVRFCGYPKEKDLYNYRFDRSFQFPKWLEEVGNSYIRKEEISFRMADKHRFEDEMMLINRIYNECWADNWGAVPMTREEILEVAKQILPFVDLDLIFFINFRDEPVGVNIVLPDVNPLLKRFDGKLGISALFKKYKYWSEINGLRGYILGIKEKYRQMGLPLATFTFFMNQITAKTQYQYLEVGWNLEDNSAINQLFEDAGAKPYRRFRIYRKEL